MVHGNINKDDEASHTTSNSLITFPKKNGKPSLSGEQSPHNFFYLFWIFSHWIICKVYESQSVFNVKVFKILKLIMFHLHSLKVPPPKEMCETVNSTSDIQWRIAASSNPRTCWSVDSQRSCRDKYNGTIPTCGFQLSKKASWETESRISIQVVFGISLATL